jgi:hypothetical protein
VTRRLNKDETIRRLRLRDMRNYLRCRYGHTLPDDDAGREDLRELLYPISVGPNAAIKMPKAIEIPEAFGDREQFSIRVIAGKSAAHDARCV